MPNTLPVGVAYSDPNLTTLYLNGTAVTSTAAELNLNAGLTATAAELNTLHSVTAGTLSASKAVVVDASSQINAFDVKTTFKLNGTTMSATAAELNTNGGVTAGTAAASKTVVLDASSQINVWDTKTTFKLNAIDVLGVLGAGKSDRLEKIAKVAANGGTDTGGGIVSWANPEAGTIIITAAWLDVTTKSSGACTASFGSTTVSATTSASNLLNGQDVGAASGTFVSSLVGLNLPTGKWVTGSKASGGSAGMVANLYIKYFLI